MTSRDTEIERIAASLAAYGFYTERGYAPLMSADRLPGVLYDAGLRSQPASEPSLDVAWKAAEAALPEGWYFRVGSRDGQGYRAIAYRVTDKSDEFYADGRGFTPAAAFQALAARLSQPTEPSEKDQE